MATRQKYGKEASEAIEGKSGVVNRGRKNMKMKYERRVKRKQDGNHLAQS